jgi:hypothetical protein
MKLPTWVCATLIACVSPAAAQQLPEIPFHTNYTYWDHHWLQWLPTHPRFEAIEASVASAGGKSFIRVWLTERAPPKRQVFYFDDAGMARAMSVGAHFVPLTYRILGEPNAPRGLDLDLKGIDGEAISWLLRFPPERRLISDFAGLKPSGGHGEESVFLLFVLGPNATTYDSRVMIGDRLHAVTPENIRADGRYYGAAYTAGAHNFVFAYGSAQVAREGAALRTSWAGGRRFEAMGGALRSQSFGFNGASAIEIVRDAGGATLYRHRFGAHDALVTIEEGGRYTVGFDDAAPVLTGAWRYDAADGSLLWAPEQPGWARATTLRTRAVPGANGYELMVSRAARTF